MTSTNQTAVERFRVPEAFWQGLDLIGLSPPAVLRQARLPATLYLRDMANRRQIRTDEFFRLWQAVDELAKDSDAGIALATRLNTSVLPPSSLAAFYARDYRDGLQRLARFKQLCAPERMIVDESEKGECTISVEWWQAPPGPPPASLTDATFASFVELGRRATSAKIIPRRLELMRPASGDNTHRDYFGCSVYFGTARNALVLNACDLDRPFPGHNPELLTMLGPGLSAALAEATAQRTIGHEVKVVLRRMMASGRPDMAQVARDLGMSERTLQRRITEEGSNFRQLLLETRQEWVRHLLAEASIEINEVAYLLGYEDVNSFYRAFRTWEGTTPARWREQHAGQPRNKLGDTGYVKRA